MSTLPAVQDESVEGEFIAAHSRGLGDLSSEHTDDHAAEELRGKPSAIDTAAIDQTWVLQRLVAEANDFGTRTRQSSRVKALELLGKHLAMFTEVVEVKDPVREALAELDPWERRKRIIELAGKLATDPAFAQKVAEKVTEK